MDNTENSQPRPMATKEDIDNIENFFTNFNLTMTENLKNKIEYWKSNQESFTEADQDELEAYLGEFVAQAEGSLFDTDIWKDIKKDCAERWYSYKFDQQVQEALSDEENG